MKKQILPFNKNKRVSFSEDFIVLNNEGKTTVLSSHCTHLGCTISRVDGNKLVCPCHGSEFDLDGNAVKGPAFKSLETIQFKIAEDMEHIHLNV